MRNALITAVLSASLMLAACSKAKGDFDIGLAAFESGDYPAALKEFEPLADKGNAQAQYYMGRLHMIGHPMPTDDAQLVRWLRKAAEQDHADAQYLLGSLYSQGIGVREDSKEMTHWYLKAANQGHPRAQNELGDMYRHGTRVVKEDIVAAYVLLTLSLENDSSEQNSAGIGLRQITPKMTEAELQVGSELLGRIRNGGSSLEKELAQR